MTRTWLLCFTFAGLAASTGAAGRQTAGPRQQLLTDVRAMQSRLERSRPPARDVVADSERLRSGFLALPARNDGRDPLDQQLARESFVWLTRASGRYRWDPAVAPSLMRTYGALCDVYRGWPSAFQPWLWVGYGGANRLARSMVLWSGDQAAERALEAYALQMTAYNYVAQNTPWYLPAQWNESQPPPAVSQPARVPEPLALPAIDEAALTAAERTRWREVQMQFRTVSSRVHQAELLLEDLAARLRARHLVINDADAATAIKMQGFLEDSVDLIVAKEFDKAGQALERADYERAKLKNIIGQ